MAIKMKLRANECMFLKDGSVILNKSSYTTELVVLSKNEAEEQKITNRSSLRKQENDNTKESK